MLTQEELLRLFRYDPETGKLYWKVARARRIKAGDEAAAVTAGRRGTQYRILNIAGLHVYQHRLVWAMNFGDIPPRFVIDHRNGDGLDNRLDNLRLCRQINNICNRNLRKDSRAGFKGVAVKGSRFYASIGVLGKRVYLGACDTAADAARLYDAAALRHYGPFAKTNAMLGLL